MGLIDCELKYFSSYSNGSSQKSDKNTYIAKQSAVNPMWVFWLLQTPYDLYVALVTIEPFDNGTDKFCNSHHLYTYRQA